MSPRIAIELTPTHLRAVVAASWRDAVLRTLEVPWSPDAPDAGIAALHELAGTVDSIAVSVGMGLLHVATAHLPPASAEARDRMLTLESDRYFATDAPLVTSLVPGGAVAMAVDAAALERWCEALERWAPIVRIDPAPVALARALGRDGRGDFHVDAEEGTHGFVSIRRGEVAAVRRIPLDLGETPGTTPPSRGSLTGRHLAAWGALLGEDAPDEGSLAPATRRRAIAARRRRRLGIAIVAAAAGLALSMASADRWRERTWRALEADVAARQDSALAGAAALAARARLDSEATILARSAAGANDGESRIGALGALAAISHALPADAVIINARAVGREWQVDGTTASAAALVPHLDRDGHFTDVRILSASARFRDGPRTRETFSIAFRVGPGT